MRTATAPAPGGAAARPGETRRLRAAMWAVALVTFAVGVTAVGARATYGARTSADEPQYLLTALSLGTDLDLDISDEIAEGAYEPFHEIALDPQTVELNDAGQRISPHDPLLPALLAVPMALGGWAAAKVALAAVAAATAAATTWFAVRRLSVPVTVAALCTGAFFVAPPLVGYATQVYPEMPAALCVLVAAGAATGPLGRRGVVAGLVAVVALPWLSVKYVAVAAVPAAVTVVRLARRDRAQATLVTVVSAVAAVVYLVVHRRIWGGWTAYASGDHFVDGEFTVVGTDPDHLGRTRRLVGLLLDAEFGLAAWTPALLLLPAALVLGLRRPRVDAATVATLVCTVAAGWSVATWVALTMHGWWWPGRQVVAVLPLAVAAIAALVQRARFLLAPVLIGCAAGLVNWIWLVVEASTGRRTIIVDFADTAAPPYRFVTQLLPDFRTFTTGDAVLTVVWLGLLAGSVVVLRRRVDEPDRVGVR